MIFTVTGNRIAENLEKVQPLGSEQSIIFPVSQPVKPTGHIQILYGNLASQGSVAKITGKEGEIFTGTAKVYDSEEAANRGIQNKEMTAVFLAAHMGLLWDISLRKHMMEAISH